LVVETVAKIRRAYFVQGESIKAICREMHISRKVVRKVLRSDATEFRYERGEQPFPRLGRWKADLDRLLTANVGKAARERLTLIRLFEELRLLGYDGGYDAVRRYARTLEPGARKPDGGGLRAVVVRAGRTTGCGFLEAAEFGCKPPLS
jgi:transposase